MIAWSDEYLLGVEAIDREHRELFRICDRILERLRWKGRDEKERLFIIRESIAYFQDYFQRHALSEEAYMRSTGYVYYDFHKELHEAFLQTHLAHFEQVAETGSISMNDAMEFVGRVIGWLQEHVTTADLAIVGKGLWAKELRRQEKIDKTVFVNSIDQLFRSTLNLDVNPQILATHYDGALLGPTVYHKIHYKRDGEDVVVLAGLEQAFLTEVAGMIYGGEHEIEPALLRGTLEMFSIGFWRDLSLQFFPEAEIEPVSNTFLEDEAALRREMQEREPALIVIGGTDKGKFFVMSSAENFLMSEKMGGG